MTVLLNSRLHRLRLRDVVAHQLTHTPGPPRPLVVVCPTCGDLFFADQYVRPDNREQELEQWEAVAKLDAECPDHPHWFTVGPYSPRS